MRTLIPISLIFALLNCYPVYSHSGRTDARGGHTDSRTGQYHYHNSDGTYQSENGQTPDEEVVEPVSIQEQATTDVQSHLFFDANTDVTWYATGFFLNVFGIGVAYFLTPDVPTTHLMGKSPEYVEVYIRVYQSEVKKYRLEKVAQGCLASSLLILYYYRLKTGKVIY